MLLDKSRKIVLLISLLLLISCSQKQESSREYGVFLGVEDTSEIKGYDLVIVDAYYLEKEDVKTLHKNNKEVYTYLNIGTLENFRDCYKDFKDSSFDVYEDWPEEYWMDVSNDKWNDYIQSKALKYKNMGLDGFFIDNTDVYAYYNSDEIYRGLLRIIHDLNMLELPIIINGGDIFVRKATASNSLTIYAVNQETVFSSIDFKNKTLGENNEKNRNYYMNYLDFCKENNLTVFLLEYTKDKKIIDDIKTYCAKNNFKYYISPNIELTGE